MWRGDGDWTLMAAAAAVVLAGTSGIACLHSNARNHHDHQHRRRRRRLSRHDHDHLASAELMAMLEQQQQVSSVADRCCRSERHQTHLGSSFHGRSALSSCLFFASASRHLVVRRWPQVRDIRSAASAAIICSLHRVSQSLVHQSFSLLESVSRVIFKLKVERSRCRLPFISSSLFHFT